MLSTIKMTPTLREGNGKGFTRMYPHKFEMIPKLRKQINLNPTTKEEALENKRITTEINRWGDGY